MNKKIDLDYFEREMEDFAFERGWEKFHNPKNLAMALSVEASELVEIFQWLTPEQAESLDANQKEHLSDELSDVLLYAIKLAKKSEINLNDAMKNKMEKNKIKYPKELCYGSSKKYNQY